MFVYWVVIGVFNIVVVFKEDRGFCKDGWIFVFDYVIERCGLNFYFDEVILEVSELVLNYILMWLDYFFFCMEDLFIFKKYVLMLYFFVVFDLMGLILGLVDLRLEDF